MTNIGKNVEKLETLCSDDGAAAKENNMAVPQNIKHGISVW
jgi:hypothetical protein